MKRRFVLKGIVTILSVLVLYTGIYSYIELSIMNKPVSMPLGIGTSVVMSGSMEPELEVDDMIIYRKAKTYEVNDVAVFVEDGFAVVHRIVSVDGNTVITKGDANNVNDDPIELSQIKGKVFAVIPGAGTYMRSVTLPLVILVIVIGVILISNKDKSIEEENKELKEKIEKLKK